MQELKELLVQWNLRFRQDRLWRKKYSIPFGSKQHLESNQIDIFLDMMEDRLFKRLEQEYDQSVKNETDYKKTGKFLKERHLPKDKEDELYKRLKLSL